MGFEHYDSGRTHLFEHARFGGSYGGNNQVGVRVAPTIYPTGYNMLYASPEDIFIYGGCYGNLSNATGSYVAKVDPDTLAPIWTHQLINTIEANEWNYPGVASLLNDGYLYVIYGTRIVKLDPEDGHIVAGPTNLPSGWALPANTSYNGFDALPDGTIIAKNIYRNPTCTNDGPNALFYCLPATNLSIMVSIDPQTLTVLDQITLPGPVGGRPTTTRFRGRDYVYMATTNSAVRYLVQNGQFTLDQNWNPGGIYQTGQTLGSAVAVMNDWFVVQCNGNPATTPMSVIVINQADASQMFTIQPFAGFPVVQPGTPGFPPTTVSWGPMSVSVDPDRNLIYTADNYPAAIGAVELTADGLRTVWTVQQRTTEFLTLIGPRGNRVIVTTEVPAGQPPLFNTSDFVVWRDAATGRELARSPELPAMTSGTMIAPYYFGKMFYLGLEGNLIELSVRPAPVRKKSN